MKRRHYDEATEWHIFARGTRRLLLFRDDADFATFLQCLSFGLRISGCELWAYALMSNHYHLVLYGNSDQLTSCMYRTNRIYARYHNGKYRLGGHVFDGPYGAVPIATFSVLLWTLGYVFLNPVKAGLCSSPETYPWSGYLSFLGESGSPLALTSTSFMSRGPAPASRAWELFHRSLEKQMKRPPRLVPGRPSMGEVHESQFEWLLDHARENVSYLTGEDPLEVAIYWGRQCGIAPRSMARALGMADSREIRQRLRRFSTRLSKNPILQHLASVP